MTYTTGFCPASPPAANCPPKIRFTRASSAVHTPVIIIRMDSSRMSPRSSKEMDLASSGLV